MGGRADDGATRAVALRYERAEERAPRVSAAGRGRMAERILALAREQGVPVRRDPDLVELLAACDLAEEIPAETFAAVAEILAWLYRQNLEEKAVVASQAPGGDPDVCHTVSDTV